MKKNILLVQSFVTLAAFSTTQILSMGKETPQIPHGFVERTDSQPLTKKKHRRKGTQLGQLAQSAEVKKETIAVEQPKDEVTVVAQPTIEAAPAPVVVEQPTAITIGAVTIELPKAEETIQTAAAPEKEAALAQAPAIETITTEKIADAAPATAVVEIAQPVVVLEKDTKEIMTPEEQKQAKMERELAEQRLAQNYSLRTLLVDVTKGQTLKHVEATPKKAAVNPFEQSTLGLETQTKELGWMSSLANSFAKKIKGNAKATLDYLTTDTFEVDNDAHIELLDNAIAECIASKDMESLMLIAQACAEKYPSVKSKKSGDLFDFLSAMYINQVKTAHTTLQILDQKNTTEFNNKSAALKEQIAQLSNTHKAMTADLAKAYEAEIKKEQEKLQNLQSIVLKTSVLLDKANSFKKVTLFPNNPLVVPANSVANVQQPTETVLSGLITRSNLPVIQGQITNQ